MELWLDTIDFDLIKDAANRLVLTGVTTNPSILSQTKIAVDKTIQHLLDIQPGLVAVQVTAADERSMLEQAKRLGRFSHRIVVKIPVNQPGMYVMKQLIAENIAVLATAIFETSQVYLSMLVGARYAAPYLSRIEKETGKSLSVMNDMLQAIKTQGSSLKLMAAAIGSKQQIMDCLLLGAQAITLPAKVYQELMCDEPHTLQSLANFQKDWSSRQESEVSSLFC